VAVDVENKFLVLSAHLPHTGLSLMDYTAVLEEITGFLLSYPKRMVILGGDLNAKLEGATDNELIGPSVPRAHLRPQDRERAGLLVELLVKHDLVASNTWADSNSDSLMVTRGPWDGRGPEAQIDFVLASRALRLALPRERHRPPPGALRVPRHSQREERALREEVRQELGAELLLGADGEGDDEPVERLLGEGSVSAEHHGRGMPTYSAEWGRQGAQRPLVE